MQTGGLQGERGKRKRGTGLCLPKSTIFSPNQQSGIHSMSLGKSNGGRRGQGYLGKILSHENQTLPYFNLLDKGIVQDFVP